MFPLLLAMLVPPTVVHVWPHGPSLEEALSATSGKPNARIVVHKGEYVLARTLLVDADHRGLTIEAAPGERPVLIGGLPVGPWVEVNHRWQTQVPDWIAKVGSRMLAIDGQMRPRSRWPETGELQHESVFDVPWMSTTGGGWKRKPTDDELTTMRFKDGDLGPWFDPMSAEVTVFHMWDESCVGVASVDFSARTIRFSSPTGHPPGAFGVNKYVVWNTSKGMSKPGQWFLDRRNRTLEYWPKPGETRSRAKAYLGTIPVLVAIKGLADVTVRGLELRVSDTPLKAGGFGAGEYDGAITAVDSPNLRIENVTVDNVAGSGIKTWNCTDSVIRRCVVTDTGAGGIRGEGDRTRIEDNVVRRVGMMYPSAIGIWSSSKDGRIEHNEVTDTSYSAIVGAGEGAVFEANYVARAMTVLHDGGGIYFGFSKGVTLRGNLIEDIQDTGGYGASAYYLDEQAQDCVVEGNVSRNIVRPSQNHMARNNAIRNNLFVNGGELHADFARCSGYTMQDNVLVCGGTIVFRASDTGFQRLTGNVFDTPGGVTMKKLVDYGEVSQSPFEMTGGNRVAPVKLRAVGKRRWKVKADGSPACEWDMSRVGPRA